MEEVVRVEKVTKIYRVGPIETVALREVSLRIVRGEFTVLAGPSGSGKTTLLNIIGTLDQPTSGEVWVGGKRIAQQCAAELARFRLYHIGFVFQAYNLIPVLTALENVTLPLILQGVAKKEAEQRAETVLEQLGIAELRAKKPNEMSGGQQQRVAIARAMVTNPAIILADEPTANLDSHTGAHLLDLMQQMNEEHNVTFLFASHDPQVIDRGRRLISIHDGAIVRDEVRSSSTAAS